VHGNALSSSFQLGIYLILGIGVLVLGILLIGVVRKRTFASLRESMDFRGFTPAELDRFKKLGLLTDDEISRLQKMMAEKALDSMKKRTEAPGEKVDMDSLVATAQKLLKEHQKPKGTSSEEES
jgi:hypothetical protein